MTTTSPEVNFVDPGARRRGSARTRSPISPAAGRVGAPEGMPIAATQLARPLLARLDPVAELGGVEGDGDVGVDGDAPGLAAGVVDTGGDVRGDHRRAAAVDRLDHRVCRVTGGAGEAGAEDRVDDDAGAGQPGERVRTDLPRPALEPLQVGRRVAGDLGRRPEEQRLDLEAEAGQAAGGDEPVATVVALAADDPRRPTGRGLGRCLGDGGARHLHQLERGDAALVDRPAVGGPHALGVIERVEPVLHQPGA